jgi:acyl-CoA synthetase (AMP-forming)/AMP-acid ligase II
MTDPREAPETEFFNAADWFIDRNIRQGRGHKTAIFTRHRNYSYNDLQKMVNKTANALWDLGVRIEDRVLMVMLDVPQFYAIFFGAIRIGAVPIPVNTMMTAKDYEYYLNDSRARVLVISEELRPVIHQIQGDLPYLRDLIVISETDGARLPFKQRYKRAPSVIKTALTTRDDPGFWLYSSGSTGSPKGAIHSMYDMVVTSRNYAQGVLGLNEQDITFSASKLFFAYGLGNNMYFPLSVGASAVLCPDRPTPETVFSYLRDFRPTVFFGVPRGWEKFMAKAQAAMESQPNAVGGVGQVFFSPNSRNVLPGKVVFTVDIRSPDQAKLDRMRARIEAEAKEICAALGVGCAVEAVGHFDPVTFAPALVARVRQAAERLGYSHMDIISGAGHDACWAAKVAPAPMVMCPCVDGLSHNEDESISKEWAAAGADVLFHAAVETAEIVA